jgi:hypothetical protein
MSPAPTRVTGAAGGLVIGPGPETGGGVGATLLEPLQAEARIPATSTRQRPGVRMLMPSKVHYCPAQP